MSPIYPFIYKYVYIFIQYLPIYLTVYISIDISTYCHIDLSTKLSSYYYLSNVERKVYQKVLCHWHPSSPPPLRCSMVERLSRCNVLNDPLCGYYGFLLQLIYIKDTLCFQNMGKHKKKTYRKVQNVGK